MTFSDSGNDFWRTKGGMSDLSRSYKMEYSFPSEDRVSV